MAPHALRYLVKRDVGYAALPTILIFIFKLLGNQEFLFYQQTLGGKYEKGSSCI